MHLSKGGQETHTIFAYTDIGLKGEKYSSFAQCEKCICLAGNDPFPIMPLEMQQT